MPLDPLQQQSCQQGLRSDRKAFPGVVESAWRSAIRVSGLYWVTNPKNWIGYCYVTFCCFYAMFRVETVTSTDEVTPGWQSSLLN
jgi:hypothetical protein